jgi:hypothetical protein
MDIDHAAGGDGDDRDRSRYVGIDRSGDLNGGYGCVARRRKQRKLIRVVHLHQIHVGISLDDRRGRDFAFGVGWFTVAACQQISA